MLALDRSAAECDLLTAAWKKRRFPLPCQGRARYPDGLGLLIDRVGKAAASIRRPAPRREFVPTVECAETSYELAASTVGPQSCDCAGWQAQPRQCNGKKDTGQYGAYESRRQQQWRHGGQSTFNNQQVMPFGGGCDDVALRFCVPGALVTI